MIQSGDERAELKEIGAYSTVLMERLIECFNRRPCIFQKTCRLYNRNGKIYCSCGKFLGEDELQALSEGAYKVLTDEEEAKIY